MAITEPFIPCFWCSGILLTNFLCHKTEPISHKTIGGAHSLSSLLSLPIHNPPFYHPVLLFSCYSCWEDKETEWESGLAHAKKWETEPLPILSLSFFLSLLHTHTHTVSVSCLHCVGWAEHSCHTVTVSLPPHSLSLSLSLLLFLSFPFPLSLLFSPSLLFLTHIRSEYTH